MKNIFRILGWILITLGLIVVPHIEPLGWKWAIPIVFTGPWILAMVFFHPIGMSDDSTRELLLTGAVSMIQTSVQVLCTLLYLVCWLAWCGVYAW